MRWATASAILALASSVSSASAQEAPKPAQAVSVAFAPPVGRPLRYRITEAQVPPRDASATVLELTVRFEKVASGYRMAFSSALSASMLHLKRVLTLTRMPYSAVLLLDDRGAITGVEDEAAYWADVERKLGDSMGQVSGATGRSLGAHLASAEVAKYRALNDQARYALIAQNVRPIIDLASTKFEPDRPVA